MPGFICFMDQEGFLVLVALSQYKVLPLLVADSCQWMHVDLENRGIDDIGETQNGVQRCFGILRARIDQRKNTLFGQSVGNLKSLSHHLSSHFVTGHPGRDQGDSQGEAENSHQNEPQELAPEAGKFCGDFKKSLHSLPLQREGNVKSKRCCCCVVKLMPRCAAVRRFTASRRSSAGSAVGTSGVASLRVSSAASSRPWPKLSGYMENKAPLCTSVGLLEKNDQILFPCFAQQQGKNDIVIGTDMIKRQPECFGAAVNPVENFPVTQHGFA